jgi:hypothetical protein
MYTTQQHDTAQHGRSVISTLTKNLFHIQTQIFFSNRFIILSRIKSLIRQLNFIVDIMYRDRGGEWVEEGKGRGVV